MRAILKRWLGIGKEADTLAQTVADLCQRARLGDQVAIGTLNEMRVAATAPKAEPRVVRSYNLALAWVKAHPVAEHGGSIGIDAAKALTKLRKTDDAHGVCGLLCGLPAIGGETALLAAALILAAKGPLNPSAVADGISVQTVREAFADEATAPTEDEINGDDPLAPYLYAARALGEAIKLQAFRGGGIPIGAYCRDMAWEVGE